MSFFLCNKVMSVLTLSQNSIVTLGTGNDGGGLKVEASSGSYALLTACKSVLEIFEAGVVGA